MTSRLRKKLEDLDEAGNNLNESFCLIGTPLPSLADTKRDQNEFVPIWKQEVRDEQGRRRFHGAFTGGFSAGYYNTVGSKEGWTPASFKSSRSNRAGNASRQQAAEDFMDEEDLQDLRNSRKLENTDTFKTDGFTSTADELGRSDSIGSALKSLVQPSSSSMGQKLLMKMGWRPGQGIGPRVSARKRKIQEAKLSGRPYQPRSEELAVDEEEGKHRFAPRDSKLMVFEQKTDKGGLGYVKGQSIQSSDAARAKIEQPSLSAGFGLGIDDADEDDMDIYHTDGLRADHGARVAFDMDDQDNIVLLGHGVVGADRARKARPDPSQDGRTLKVKKKVEAPGDNHKWSDGKPVITGFVIDPNATTQDKWFDFPSVPDGWRPRPSRVWHKGSKWDQTEPVALKPLLPNAEKRSALTADQRGDILGEEQLQSSTKSIFEYMSAKSKERLAQATGAHQLTGVSLTVEEPAEPRDGVIVPPLSPRTASAALKGFIPFGDDPAKQERYKSYLVSQTHNTADPNPKLLPGRPVHEINKELSDFSKSAAMFKPMSFAMANRFTTSSASAQDVQQPKPGLHVPDPDKLGDWLDSTKTPAEVKEVLTPRQEAAKAGMYGKMTRTEEDWAPNKLLCKRFGVADPYPDGLPGTTNQEPATPSGGPLGTRPLLTAPGQDVAWQSKFINVPLSEDAPSSGSETGANGPRRPKTLAEVGLADDENQGRDTLTYKKPEIDIFKAIFADADDDNDDEDDDQEGDEKPGRSNPLGMLKPAAIPPSKLRQPVIEKLGEGSALAPLDIIGRDIDPASYRPVFARPSSKRGSDKLESDLASNSEAADTEGRRSKKSRKEKKKANKILMSFDVGEEEEDDNLSERKSKKMRDKPQGRRASPEDDGVWVEKEAVVDTQVSSKRKRAEDFL
ncbi:hypothetical protein NliqN6_6207 [Naganishia liquefaciens]|uniref:G-patch domain-containing protein n=1 Tax=Naganishia liquefaciens TaxID=104408 RepID=A0A8H3TZN4_9TREE|nr:hypothetical protein NliqN6_6207 [Naganishia liquefaciens]